jgi:hypothetical protein
MWNRGDLVFIGYVAAGVGVIACVAVNTWDAGREYGRREQYKLMLDKLNQKDKANDR